MEVSNSGGRFEAKSDDRTDLEVLLDKIKGLEHEDVKTKRGNILTIRSIPYKNTLRAHLLFFITLPPFFRILPLLC